MTYEPPPIEHHPCVDTRGGDVRLVHTWDQRGSGACVDCGETCMHTDDTFHDGGWDCLSCGRKERA